MNGDVSIQKALFICLLTDYVHEKTISIKKLRKAIHQKGLNWKIVANRTITPCKYIALKNVIGV